jgi:hypothetical protein
VYHLWKGIVQRSSASYALRVRVVSNDTVITDQVLLHVLRINVAHEDILERCIV